MHARRLLFDIETMLFACAQAASGPMPIKCHGSPAARRPFSPT
jgi:hypothetical protein